MTNEGYEHPADDGGHNYLYSPFQSDTHAATPESVTEEAERVDTALIGNGQDAYGTPATEPLADYPEEHTPALTVTFTSPDTGETYPEAADSSRAAPESREDRAEVSAAAGAAAVHDTVDTVGPDDVESSFRTRTGDAYRGRINEALTVLTQRLSAAGIDPTTLIPGNVESLRDRLPLLVNPTMSNAEVAARLGVTENHVSGIRRRAYDVLSGNIPSAAGIEIPRIEAFVPTSRLTAAGSQLAALRKDTGLDADAVAAQLDTSRPALTRFERGEAYPVPSKVLEPLMDVLQVSPERREELRALYEYELLKHRTKPIEGRTASPEAATSWGRGQVPEALAQIDTILRERDIPAASLLPADAYRLRQTAANLMDNTLSEQAIAAIIGVTPASLYALRSRLLNQLVAGASPELAAAFPKPLGQRTGEPPRIGTYVERLRSVRGVSVEAVVTAAGITRADYEALTGGTRSEQGPQILARALFALRVHPRTAEAFTEWYRKEVETR